MAVTGVVIGGIFMAGWLLIVLSFLGVLATFTGVGLTGGYSWRCLGMKRGPVLPWSGGTGPRSSVEISNSTGWIRPSC